MSGSKLSNHLGVFPAFESDRRNSFEERANAMLAAVGYNFHLLLRWFASLLRALIQALLLTDLAPLTAWLFHESSERFSLMNSSMVINGCPMILVPMSSVPLSNPSRWSILAAAM